MTPLGWLVSRVRPRPSAQTLPHSLPPCYYNECKKKRFMALLFQTVIPVHMCLCAPLLPCDGDRWIGSHHIYQRKQFMEARWGRACARLNSAFQAQPSIRAEASGLSRLRSWFVREDEPAGDKAAARGFVVQRRCRRSAGLQTSGPTS